MPTASARVKAPLPPAMEAIVSEVELRNINYLTHNRTYSKIGTSQVLATDPSVLHFGGFQQLGQVYRQTVRVRNISSTGTRHHIVPPTTPFFKAICDDKKGLLAPGMADVVEVEFCPQEFRYYHDCICIHSEEANLLIPIHAYPIMNETKFPRRVDFGKVAFGDSVVKRYKMECKVPMEFEFEIHMVTGKGSPHFKVEPQRGIVPAHGHVTICITYEPLTLATHETVLEVRVAELNAVPILCSVTGSAAAGIVKDRVLRDAVGFSKGDSLSSVVPPASAFLPKLTMEQLDGTQLFKTQSRTFMTNKGGGAVRGGAGGGDAYTNLIMTERKAAASMRDCRTTGPILSVPPKLPPPTAEVVIDGIYVPDTALKTNADVAYVLNQEPGKLRIKDVKEAIRTKKAGQESERAALDAIMAQGLGEGVHPLERPEVPAHIKAALFSQLLAQAEEQARRVALGSGVHLGDDILPAEAVAEAQRLREGQHNAHQQSTELAATSRLEAVLEPAGALHLPFTRAVLPGDMPGGGGEGDSAGPQDAVAGAETSGQPQTLSGAAFAAVALSSDHLYRPAWRLIEANDLKKRADILTFWQRVSWRVIYTRRLKKHLAKIRDVLAQLGWDKQRLAEESANPVLLVSEADRPGTAPTKHLKPDNVRTRPLPLYRDINFTYHGPVPGSHYTDFDELGPQAPRTPLEYKLLGFSEEVFPGLTPYAPPLLDQPLEAGAPEERPTEGPQPSGVVSEQELAALPAMPDAMKTAPFTVLEIGNRYTQDKVFALPEPSWGMDTAYQIQPQVYPFHDSTAHEVAASISTRALAGETTLSERWLPRKERWAVQLTDEYVPPFLSGPDPGDLLRDSPEDADKPAIEIRVPTDDDIARYLPPGMPNALLSRPQLAAQSAAAGGPKQQQQQLQPQQQQQPAGSSGASAAGAQQQGQPSAAATAAPAGQQEQGGKLYELMRQKKQDELDAARREARLSSVQALESKINQYNSNLKLPCHFAVIM